MTLVPLSALVEVSSNARLPRDKTALIRKLDKLGARRWSGETKRGQKGFVYDAASLPIELQIELADAGKVEKTASTEAWERYHHAPVSLQADARASLSLVHGVKAMLDAGSTLVQAFARAGEQHRVSTDTAKRAWRKVRDVPENLWLPALVKSYKPRQAEDIAEEILSYFFADYGRMEQPKALPAWERTVKAAGANGWGEVPSAKTLKRRWDALPAEVRLLWREGERALAGAHPHADRGRSYMRPLDLISTDGRTWDVFVRLPDGRVVRPMVVMVQDVASNLLLSYEIAETESTDSYRRAICRAFTDYGIAKGAQFDNTRAAANKTITGGAKTRFRFKIKDDDLPGILPRIGCLPHFTQPYNGRSKTVERLFGEVKERSEKDPRCAGAYVGRSPDNKPANYGETAVDLEVFRQVLAEAVEHYNTRVDRRSKVADGRSHREAFEAGLADTKVVRLSEQQRRFFFSSCEKRTVSTSGTVTLGKRPHENRYHHIDLLAYAGRQVVVWYDPDDLKAPLWAETLEGRLITEGIVCLEARGFNSVEDAKAYNREKRQFIKATKAKAAAINRMSHLEMLAALPAAPPPSPLPDPKVIQPIFNARPKPADDPGSTGFSTEQLNLALRGMERMRRAVGDYD